MSFHIQFWVTDKVLNHALHYNFLLSYREIAFFLSNHERIALALFFKFFIIIFFMTKTTKDETTTEETTKKTPAKPRVKKETVVAESVETPKVKTPKVKVSTDIIDTETLPEEVIAEVIAAVEATGPTFADRNLRPTILESLTKKGYMTPTPIQILTFKHFTEGHHIVGESQT
jgi:hypothetical protein